MEVNVVYRESRFNPKNTIHQKAGKDAREAIIENGIARSFGISDSGLVYFDSGSGEHPIWCCNVVDLIGMSKKEMIEYVETQAAIKQIGEYDQFQDWMRLNYEGSE